MTEFQFLRKVEVLDSYLEEIKAFLVSLGAKKEAFLEADAKWNEIKDAALKKVSGGIVSESPQNPEIDGGEYIIPNCR